MDTNTHRAALTVPQGLLLTTLVLLSASGLVASDINLPGMPLAARALESPITALQQTFSVYVIGLAVAQALYGALSDTYGRRRLVIGGMTVYAVASIACALAPSRRRASSLPSCPSSAHRLRWRRSWAAI